MKTILFFYQDVILNRSVCSAYVTDESKVSDLIKWKKKCLGCDIKEGNIKCLVVTIVDKLSFSMLQL